MLTYPTGGLRLWLSTQCGRLSLRFGRWSRKLSRVTCDQNILIADEDGVAALIMQLPMNELEYAADLAAFHDALMQDQYTPRALH